MRSRIFKIEGGLLGGRATTVNHYRKINRAKKFLAASRVGGIVTIEQTIVSPVVELMRKHILTDNEWAVFSLEVHLHPGHQHPKVWGTGWLGFAELDLYLNTKCKSMKPRRLVGERAAAEQETGRIFWLIVGLSRVLPPSGRLTVFLCPRKKEGNGASWSTNTNLMRPPCLTRKPCPSFRTCWKINPNTRFSLSCT